MLAFFWPTLNESLTLLSVSWGKPLLFKGLACLGHGHPGESPLCHLMKCNSEAPHSQSFHGLKKSG